MADEQSHTTEDARRLEQRQRDQCRVDTFVIRARRIEAHSLAQDTERLIKLAHRSRGCCRIPVRR